MKSTTNNNPKTTPDDKEETKPKLSEKIDRLKRYIAAFLGKQSEKTVITTKETFTAVLWNTHGLYKPWVDLPSISKF